MNIYGTDNNTNTSNKENKGARPAPIEANNNNAQLPFFDDVFWLEIIQFEINNKPPVIIPAPPPPPQKTIKRKTLNNERFRLSLEHGYQLLQLGNVGWDLIFLQLEYGIFPQIKPPEPAKQILKDTTDENSLKPKKHVSWADEVGNSTNRCTCDHNDLICFNQRTLA